MNLAKIKELEDFIKLQRLPFTVKAEHDRIYITAKNAYPVAEFFIDKIEQMGYKLCGITSLNTTDIMIAIREFDFSQN